MTCYLIFSFYVGQFNGDSHDMLQELTNRSNKNRFEVRINVIKVPCWDNTLEYLLKWYSQETKKVSVPEAQNEQIQGQPNFIHAQFVKQIGSLISAKLVQYRRFSDQIVFSVLMCAIIPFDIHFSLLVYFNIFCKYFKLYAFFDVLTK